MSQLDTRLPEAPHPAAFAAPAEAVGDSAHAAACEGCPLRVELPRRTFLGGLTAALAALLVFPARRAEAKKVGMTLSQVKALQMVGGAAVVKVKGRDILLVRDTKASVKAINPMCTHKKCLVHYKPAQQGLACQCHKSAFTLDGQVMGGPAPRPLETFPAELRGEQIVLTLPDA